jgi:hypothetical protein
MIGSDLSAPKALLQGGCAGFAGASVCARSVHSKEKA